MIDNVATCSYITPVITVGVRELKNRLSEFLREVRAGERVLVSDRGMIVAELREATGAAIDGVPPGLADLARAGQVTLASLARPPVYPKLRPAADPAPASERGRQ